jgi:arginine deiminase
MYVPRIESEIHPLNCIFLAKPHYGLNNLNFLNYKEYLFNGFPSAEGINEQFAHFSNIFSIHGITTFFVEDLLTQTLEIPAARQWLVNKLFDHTQDTAFYHALRTGLYNLDSQTFANYLIGGSFLSQILKNFTKYGKEDFLLFQPLPNIFFTRDTSSWLFNGVIISAMKYEIRKREALIMSCIYRFHQHFNQVTPCKIWFDGIEIADFEITLEGGDIMLLNKHVLLIGNSERTSLKAIQLIAKKLLQETEIKYVISPILPKTRNCIHLDMIMSMVNHHTFCLANGIVNLIETVWVYNLDQATNELERTQLPDLITSLQTYFHPESEFISFDEEQQEAAEQQTCANNLIAISPGTVISYEQNYFMNTKLRNAGIHVISIPSSYLLQGHGGTHCMSCPISRAEVTTHLDNNFINYSGSTEKSLLSGITI